MINAWSLLYDEIYGDDEMTDNTITPQESDEYDPKPKSVGISSSIVASARIFFITDIVLNELPCLKRID